MTYSKPLTKLKHGRKRAYATAAVEAVDRAKKEAKPLPCCTRAQMCVCVCVCVRVSACVVWSGEGSFFPL